MTAPRYRYSERGRRPLTVAAALVAVALVGFGAWQGAPWFWLAIVGTAAAMLLGLVVRNTETWLEIDGESLRWFDAQRRCEVPLGRIDRVEIVEWTDSTDVRLHLDDGTEETIADRSRPPVHRLIPVLEAHGLTVDRH